MAAHVPHVLPHVMQDPFCFYAVRRGVCRGIYFTWDDCRLQIEHFDSPEYDVFHDVHEAVAYAVTDIADTPIPPTHQYLPQGQLLVPGQETQDRAHDYLSRAQAQAQVHVQTEVASARKRSRDDLSPVDADSKTQAEKKKEKAPPPAASNPTWDANLEELKKYKEQHGNVDAPQKTRLGLWVKAQRTEYRNLREGKPSKLSALQIQRLNDLGFKYCMYKTGRTFSWEERFEQLRKFKEEHGHTRVVCPTSFNRGSVSDERAQLGSWVSRQRYDYYKLEKGRPNKYLNEERIRRLEELGFEWHVQNKIKMEGWEQKLKQFKEYLEEHGDLAVPTEYKTNGLGSYAAYLRTQYVFYKQGTKSHLNEEKVQQMDEMGFRWSLTQDKWDHRMDQLRAFKAEHGHLRIRRETKPVGQFATHLRSHYALWKAGKKSQLTEERIKTLEEMEFPFSLPRGRPKGEKSDKPPAPKKKRGRPRKAKPTIEKKPKKQKKVTKQTKQKKKRGRPRKVTGDEAEDLAAGQVKLEDTLDDNNRPERIDDDVLIVIPAGVDSVLPDDKMATGLVLSDTKVVVDPPNEKVDVELSEEKMDDDIPIDEIEKITGDTPVFENDASKEEV